MRTPSILHASGGGGCGLFAAILNDCSTGRYRFPAPTPAREVRCFNVTAFSFLAGPRRPFGVAFGGT